MYINAYKGRLEILVFSVQTTHFHTVYKCAVPSKTEVIERVRINQWYHLYHFDGGTILKTKILQDLRFKLKMVLNFHQRDKINPENL